MDIKFKDGYSRMTGYTTGNHPEYDRGFRNGQQSKQAEIEHRTQVSAELAGELIRKRAEIDALKDCITELVKQKNKSNAKLDNIQEIIELKTSGSFTSVLRKIDAISEELLK